MPFAPSFSNLISFSRESLSQFWHFVVMKLDQFHETETKHCNARFGDHHSPLRMLHRALGKTDWQVPGAPLFHSLSPDLPHRTEKEGKKRVLIVIKPTFPNLDQTFSWFVGDGQKAALPQHLGQEKGKGLGLDS